MEQSINNIEVEKAIIGILIKDESKRFKLKILKEENFYNNDTRILFLTLNYLYENKRNIDLINIESIAKKRNISMDFIVGCTYNWELNNWEDYLEKLLKYTDARK